MVRVRECDRQRRTRKIERKKKSITFQATPPCPFVGQSCRASDKRPEAATVTTEAAAAALSSVTMTRGDMVMGRLRWRGNGDDGRSRSSPTGISVSPTARRTGTVLIYNTGDRRPPCRFCSRWMRFLPSI